MPAPEIEIGIVDYGVSPTGWAKCLVCGDPIPKDAIRLTYRTKPRLAPKFTRFVHVHCLRRLPEQTREHDVRRIRRWLEEPDLLQLVYDTLDNAAAALSGVGGASGSGGGAVT